jgi:hypothetical protein
MALGVRGAWGLCEDCEPWDCAMCRDCIYMGSMRGKHSKTHLEHKLRHGSAVAGNSDGATSTPLPSRVNLRESASTSPRSAAAANGDGALARPTTMYFLEEATAAAGTAMARSPPSYTDAVSSTAAPVIGIGKVSCCPLLSIRLLCCCCSPN